ncbi:DUF2357 domain-containing protein [Bacillus anthracis]|uniref:DUF2357 domain-containing protein n=1 Tax=Bacillus anthracis TaxID=1392 RepID=UPI002DBB7DE4|nr:DUF2357 domain-containing protein [Bacillus anthracis]MEB9458422.1 DUF2357 domain-containing protein [Bacillus anthracis]
MIPVMPELDRLEKLASSQSPSIEGAWWHTLQLVEHLTNSVVARDSINNVVMDELLSTILSKNDLLELHTTSRPIPYDMIHQLMDFCMKAVERIVRNPRKKLLKESKMISTHKLKTQSSKTMNWIAKQPGRNIREKLAGKNRVLAEQSVYSADTKENQVLMKVIKDLTLEIQNRMEYGINADTFDFQNSNMQKLEELKGFLEFTTKLKYTELANVTPMIVTQPNNVLINDKYYSIIWRTYQSLNMRKHKVMQSWQHAFSRYIFMFYMQLIARMERLGDMQLKDEVGRLVDSEGKLSLQFFEKNRKFPADFDDMSPMQHVSSKNAYQFYYAPFIKGKVQMVQHERSFGFVTSETGRKVHFHSTVFQNRQEFDELRVNDIVYFQSEIGKKGESAVLCQKTEALYSIQLKLENDTIYLQLDNLQLQPNSAEFKIVETKNLRYQFQLTQSEPEFNRGIPFVIQEFENANDLANYETQGFADMKSMNHMLSTILCKLQKEFHLPVKERERAGEVAEVVSEIGIDFTQNQPELLYNEKYFTDREKMQTILFKKGYETFLDHPVEGHLYDMRNNVYSLANIFGTEKKDYSKRLQSFSDVFSELRNTFTVAADVPFLYTVPDNIDEFSQKDVKKSMSVYFKSSFPFWRSIAGALQDERNNEMKKIKSVLVIDTHGEKAGAVQLKRIEHEHKTYFQHYPPFEVVEESESITLQAYLLHYFEEYCKKYELKLSKNEIEHILNSGMLEDVVLQKKSHLLIHPGTLQPIKLMHDEGLIRITFANWLKHFQRYVVSLKETLKEEKIHQFDVVLIIGDHVKLHKIVSEQLKGAFKIKRYTVMNTKMLLQAVVNENIKEKLAKSETLWFEYLPDLSLEVIRNGNYDQLHLIKDKAIGNTMGVGKVFEVEETLILPKGQSSYRFPLLKGAASVSNSQFNAIIKDASFPLIEDTEVKLKIEYKYGYENSYRLIISPLKNTCAFKEIEAQWLEDDDIKLQTKAHLAIPSGQLSEIELAEEIGILQRRMKTTERLIERQLTKPFADEKTIQDVHRLFHSTIYRLRKIVANNSPLTAQFAKNFYESQLFMFCVGMRKILPEHLKEEKYENAIENLLKDILRYVCSFGSYIHPDMIQVVLQNDEKVDASVICALTYGHSDNEQVLTYIQKKMRQHTRTVVRSLRDSFWRDTKALKNLYRYDSTIIDCMLQEITMYLKRTNKQKRVENPTVFRDYCEVLLALLALREEEGFTKLQIGSAETLMIARYVRTIDALCYVKQGEPLKSYLQFDLQKPESLSNMSDLAFVLNAYLTGDLMDNLISVRDISID